MKTTLNGEKIKILRTLQLKVPQAGKKDKFVDLVDNEGSWIVVEFLTGANKGCRVPTTQERLT